MAVSLVRDGHSQSSLALLFSHIFSKVLPHTQEEKKFGRLFVSRLPHLHRLNNRLAIVPSHRRKWKSSSEPRPRRRTTPSSLRQTLLPLTRARGRSCSRITRSVCGRRPPCFACHWGMSNAEIFARDTNLGFLLQFSSGPVILHRSPMAHPH